MRLTHRGEDQRIMLVHIFPAEVQWNSVEFAELEPNSSQMQSLSSSIELFQLGCENQEHPKVIMGFNYMCWVCNLNQIGCNHHGGSHYLTSLTRSVTIYVNFMPTPSFQSPQSASKWDVQLIRVPAIVGNGRPEAQVLKISPSGETVRFSHPNVDLKVQGLIIWDFPDVLAEVEM
ncbi:hypothetical protein B0H16DRAFT_1451359 [Mycena metata]|uniref:Uncharacterized protein n=1 Tax=Mycena metata TaxID=1033252 RepID=A0AAD7JUX0_9AGAR|nr:hypothetical protein B0H16DRAFT_1451359 [Mycena metata]